MVWDLKKQRPVITLKDPNRWTGGLHPAPAARLSAQNLGSTTCSLRQQLEQPQPGSSIAVWSPYCEATQARAAVR